jgi:hypothetical protein
MNTKLKLIGAALVALAILPAAVLLFHVNPLHALMGLVTVAGVVTVTYQSFQAQGNFGGAYTGGITPPTKAQAVQVQAVVATGGNGGHRHHGGHYAQYERSRRRAWRRSSRTSTWYISTPGTALPLLSFALTDANTVTVNKTSLTGSGGTYTVIIRRPYSASQ